MTSTRLDWRIVTLALWAIAFTLVPAPQHQVVEANSHVTVEVLPPENASARRARLLGELERGEAFAALAVAELAAARDPGALPLLVEKAFEPHGDPGRELVATRALRALGRYEDATARRALYQVAGQVGAGHRRYFAVQALRESPRLEDAPALREALRWAREQDDALAFDEAAEALAELGVPLAAEVPAINDYT